MEQKAHILFVDDEQLLHGLFERLFARHGMTVTCCSDATQAIEALKKTAYDLVVTDFMMPDIDGLELLSYIRKGASALVKVIMITAHSNVQHAVRSMKNGAIDYIPKPFSTTELVERVQKCLAVKDDEELPVVAHPRSRKNRHRGKKVEYVGEHPRIKKLEAAIAQGESEQGPCIYPGGERHRQRNSGQTDSPDE